MELEPIRNVHSDLLRAEYDKLASVFIQNIEDRPLDTKATTNETITSIRAENENLTEKIILSLIEKTYKVDDENNIELVDLLTDTNQETRVSSVIDVSVTLAELREDDECINVIVRGFIVAENNQFPSFSMFYSVQQGDCRTLATQRESSSTIHTGRISIGSGSASIELGDSDFSFNIYQPRMGRQSKSIIHERGFLVFENQSQN